MGDNVRRREQAFTENREEKRTQQQNTTQTGGQNNGGTDRNKDENRYNQDLQDSGRRKSREE